MVRGSTSRLVFINSTVNTHHDRAKVSLPSNAFTADGEERLALSLLQFSMRRNWYNINATNCQGHIYVQSTHFVFTIEPGVYSSFASLEVALNAALGACVVGIPQITSIVAGYDAVKRHFVFTADMAAGHTNTGVEFKFYAIKDGFLPAGVTLNSGFNDIHEILGGIPIRDAGSSAHSLLKTSTAGANPQIFRSYYPASLNTLDAIFIHLSTLETGNFASTGFNKNIADEMRVHETSLFARIPFDRSSFDEVHEVVSYTDSGGDQFQAFPLRKHLEQIELRITDSKGRSLAELDTSQSDNGLMGFTMVLRFDIFKPPQRPPSGQVQKNTSNHPPTITTDHHRM